MSTENGQEPVVAESTETEREPVVETPLKELSNDQLIDYIGKLNKENAKHRVAKQSVNAELDEFKKWKESQMSKEEKLAADNVALSKKARKADQFDVALQAGLDLDFYELVNGDTEDEMLENAKKLAAKLPAKDSVSELTGGVRRIGPPSSVFQGARGEAVNESKSEDPNQAGTDWLNSQLWK